MKHELNRFVPTAVTYCLCAGSSMRVQARKRRQAAALQKAKLVSIFLVEGAEGRGG